MAADDVSLILARHFLGSFAPEELAGIEGERQPGELNVLWFRPKIREDVSVLLTIGMSAVLLQAEDPRYNRRAELCMILPRDWGLSSGRFESGNEPDYHDWPITAMAATARLPMELGTAVGPGDTIVMDEMRLAGTGFTALLVAPPRTLPPKACEIKGKGATFSLWSLVPIYPEEREYSARCGGKRLLELFAESGVTEVVNVNRANVCRNA
ncbi:MAG: suppressor of fused domain protein [Deltaproteobacteria bacterium]|jgi:hypothetical protein|nr:suppressor of fused domain protein [Deltaproteobacteria bacterium]